MNANWYSLEDLGKGPGVIASLFLPCPLYTSDAPDEEDNGDLVGGLCIKPRTHTLSHPSP